MSIVKETERLRRRGGAWVLATAAVIAVAAMTLWFSVALAVHDTGVFQLDGNAETAVDNGSVPADEDWDVICKAHPGSCTFAGDFDPSGLGATSSTDSQFVTETDPDSILTGGSTKDDLDIQVDGSGWRWKTASPSPDKNDLLHAFAAKYTEGENQYIYFGADRFSNAGNANIAFWFFQNEVGLLDNDGANDGVCGGNGCPFTGTHVAHDTNGTPNDLSDDTPGDLLVVSAFTGGGTQPNIAVYEWWGKGNAPAALCANNECSLAVVIPTAAGAPCDTPALAGDNACAIVNGVEAGGTVSPWVYQEKSTKNFAANRFGDGDFFEGGLNLTALGYADVCLSSFLVNTRSSQSVDSVLHDFALGDLGGCTSSTVTVPSDGSGSTITDPLTTGLTIGTDGTVEVRDQASVTVTGINTWSGSVDFYLCGPISLASTCGTGGVSIGSVAVDQSTVMPVLSPDDSAYVTEANNFASGSETKYCWRAEFVPTTPSDLPGSTDSTLASECFVVHPVQPTLTTQAQETVPVPLGSSVSDKATLSGTANQPGDNGPNATYPSINATNGAAAGGTITFQLLQDDCSTQEGSDQTASVSGDDTYGPVSVTPSTPGDYHWVATYDGDSPNTLGTDHNTSCDDTNEDVTVQRLLPSISTEQRFLPNDRATVSVVDSTPSAGNLKGTVYFELFVGSSSCSGSPAYTESINIDAATPVTTVWTSNTSVFVTSSQAVSWQVTYTSTNSAHKSIPASCHENSSLTITNDGSEQAPAD